jgi:hypothetical protein
MDSQRKLARAADFPADQGQMLLAVGSRVECDRAKVAETRGKVGDRSDHERWRGADVT